MEQWPEFHHYFYYGHDMPKHETNDMKHIFVMINKSFE